VEATGGVKIPFTNGDARGYKYLFVKLSVNECHLATVKVRLKKDFLSLTNYR